MEYNEERTSFKKMHGFMFVFKETLYGIQLFSQHKKTVDLSNILSR